jgi:hypothetical protein
MGNTKRHENEPLRFPQVSLRVLLVSTLVLGALAGTFGPSLAEAIRQGDAPEPPVVIGEEGYPPVGSRADLEPLGYFESAESPLR